MEQNADARSPAPVHSATGVDIGLIRWFLTLTPMERLETLQNFVDFVTEARNAREAGEVR
ncbi:MAG: hypothetical protein FJX72_06580 [Armatimonadetes bacterium]|nr:hypothetical protein [Armatimonadota bacterium]